MSIKKCSLIAAATVVAALAMASSAFADQGAELATSQASPTTNNTAGKAMAGGLFLEVQNCETADTSCTGSTGTAPTQVIDGIDLINISWSGQVGLAKPKNPVCNPATISALTYKNALIACNGSQLGNGGATVCLGGIAQGSPCSAVTARTLVFRGPDFTDSGGLFGAAGKVYTQLLLYADIGVGVAVVPSILTPANSAEKANGYKTSLRVFGSGDPVSPPSQSITNFHANVNSGLKVKCGLAGQTGNVNILYQGVWVVDGGAPKQDQTTQNCSYVP